MTNWNISPEDIEKKSFEIIDAEAGPHPWPKDQWTIIRRMIHTTADFDWMNTVRIHEDAMAAADAAIFDGCKIFTDTKMAMSGISTKILSQFGVSVDCHIADPQVAELAKASNSTRAAAAVDYAGSSISGSIYVVGNAPTALFRLIEKINLGQLNPALVVGLPVGFVNADQSKEELTKCVVPYITALGRKGGSAVAASVINALARLAQNKQNEDSG